MVSVTKTFFVFLLFLFFTVSNAYATCELTSSTLTLPPNESTDFAVTFKNTSETIISAILIPLNFSPAIGITSHEIQESGWTVSENSDFYVYSGSLDSNQTVTFNFSVNTNDESTASWPWQTSENSSGESSVECGTLNLNVLSQSVTLEPVITNTYLTVGNNQATLTWNTDTATTGVVNFGTTTGYGSSVTTSSGTSHTATLSSLSASTTYHYQIQVTGQGGTTATTDAVLTTSAADVTVTTTTTITNTVTNTIQNTITKILSDTTPPTINITTDFSKPLKESGSLEGIATDTGLVNVGISSLEYSIDGGKNWLPITDINSPNTKKTSFSFFPNIKDDGNYTIKVKARDLSGNIGVSKAYTLIIDRLPPSIGGTVFLNGPLALQTNNMGNIFTILGLPIDVTLSAVGGPILIDINSNNEKFGLKKNVESGLWHGTLTFSSEGIYSLKSKSIDGGKNETEKDMGNITVLPAGKVTNIQGKVIKNAKVSVFTLEKITNQFVLWQSEPFSQTNPQYTDENGSYRFVLPAGKYYLQIESKNKIKLRTNIFDISNVTPINQNFLLEQSNFWNMWWSKTVSYTAPNFSSSSNLESTLIGKPILDFNLSTENNTISNISILGKPTLITFFTSWDPLSTDQVKELDYLKKENDSLNVYAIALQESVSKVNIFQKIGGFNIDIVADPDGIFVIPLSLKSLPTHLFIDKKGIIKSVKDGYLSKTSLLIEILK